MVGLLEAGKLAFKSYRKDLISSIIFGLFFTIAIILKYIPIIGAIIGAYLYPRILGWYYIKTIGNINLNYKLSFKTWLLYLFITHLGMLIMFTILLVIGIFEPVSKNITNNATNSNLTIGSMLGVFVIIVIPIILFVVWFMFYYPLYASLLGKINELKITSETMEGSGMLFLYTLVWRILLSLIEFFLLLLSIANIEVFWFIFAIIVLFEIFVKGPILELITAHIVLSM